MHHSYSISCADYKNGDYPKIYNDQVQSRNHGLTQAGKKNKNKFKLIMTNILKNIKWNIK